jgi:hypothetical protein
VTAREVTNRLRPATGAGLRATAGDWNERQSDDYLETLGALLREIQADQRNIRTEQETIRGLIMQEASSIQTVLAVFQTALLGRLGDSEALIETRLDAIEAKLGGAP